MWPSWAQSLTVAGIGSSGLTRSCEFETFTTVRVVKAPIDFDGSRFGDLGPLAFSNPTRRLHLLTRQSRAPSLSGRSIGEVNVALPYLRQ